ncbi:MAG: crossover junction endodeoxyribonuclease RuvC [Spirochaetales bacterium]|nr:crossover junction endodeoxyribonuclease RuvC [Spirochaetales bacterium]
MRTILGIDPGLKNTGFGVIQIKNDQIYYVDHGVISTETELDHGSRLEYIHKNIIELIKKHKPHEAAVEEIFFAKNLKSAIPVAEAKGVILCALSIMKTKVFTYTPLEIKRGVVGNGRAEKVQVQELVRIILKLKTAPQPDHAADALAVALCHTHSSRLKQYLYTRGKQGV